MGDGRCDQPHDFDDTGPGSPATPQQKAKLQTFVPRRDLYLCVTNSRVYFRNFFYSRFPLALDPILMSLHQWMDTGQRIQPLRVLGVQAAALLIALNDHVPYQVNRAVISAAAFFGHHITI